MDSVVEALTGHLQGTGSGSLYCPRAAPTQGVVSCTYEQWFKPYSPRRRYCQLPVSGRRMQRFCSLGWAVMACQLLLAGWLAQAMSTGLTGVCLACNSGAIGDEMHMVLSMPPWLLRGDSMQTFSHLILTPCAPFLLSRTIWGS